VLTPKVVEQNTKAYERLEATMVLLCQAVTDLRVQMVQGQAKLRTEIALVRTELHKEIAQTREDLHKYFDRKFMWLLTTYYGSLFTLLGFLSKYVDRHANLGVIAQHCLCQ
jgi:hypothetical protein